MVDPADRSELHEDDFRRIRAHLAPHLFLGGEEGQTYPPPSDLIDEEQWESIMALPTDVALATSSYTGSRIGAIHRLQSDWIFSWPEFGEAPFMGDACLLAGEEFDALVFNALHGYYRQAIGCLRNALEIMTVAAGLAVQGNSALYERWHEKGQEISFGQARAWLRDCVEGRMVDAEAAPDSVFGDGDTAWLKERYATLCAYAHSRAGYNNADFWESNGPVYRPRALEVVDEELRETLALCYLLLRLGWPGYGPGQGQSELLGGPRGDWAGFEDLLRRWLP